MGNDGYRRAGGAEGILMGAVEDFLRCRVFRLRQGDMASFHMLKRCICLSTVGWVSLQETEIKSNTGFLTLCVAAA